MGNSETLYSEKIAEEIFLLPLNTGADHLCILVDEASPSMASWLLAYYEKHKVSGIQIDLMIGSTSQKGILRIYHEYFKSIQKQHSGNSAVKFTCSYLYGAVPQYSNSYIWLQNNTPICAFGGRIDFLQSSILMTPQILPEILSPDASYSVYSSCIDCSAHCRYQEIEELVCITENGIDKAVSQSADKVTLTLLKARGNETGKKSGLNWGQRKGRNPNEAYIPVPRAIAKSGFFPLNEQHFMAVTDDNILLLFRVEQQGDKAITTPESNARLGEYFRKRLNLPNGEYVSKYNLEQYGRTDVEFYKIDDEQFYMNFSVDSRQGR